MLLSTRLERVEDMTTGLADNDADHVVMKNKKNLVDLVKHYLAYLE